MATDNRAAIERRHPGLQLMGTGTVHYVTTSGTTARNGSDITADVCTIVAQGGAVWFKQGDDTVTVAEAASDAVYLPADTYREIVTISDARVAAIWATGSSAARLVIEERT